MVDSEKDCGLSLDYLNRAWALGVALSPLDPKPWYGGLRVVFLRHNSMSLFVTTMVQKQAPLDPLRLPKGLGCGRLPHGQVTIQLTIRFPFYDALQCFLCHPLSCMLLKLQSTVLSTPTASTNFSAIPNPAQWVLRFCHCYSKYPRFDTQMFQGAPPLRLAP